MREEPESEVIKNYFRQVIMQKFRQLLFQQLTQGLDAKKCAQSMFASKFERLDFDFINKQNIY
jgi:hypothetical protein